MMLEKQEETSHGVAQRPRKAVPIIFHVPLRSTTAMRHELMFFKDCRGPCVQGKVEGHERKSRRPVQKLLRETGKEPLVIWAGARTVKTGSKTDLGSAHLYHLLGKTENRSNCGKQKGLGWIKWKMPKWQFHVGRCLS